MKKSDILLSFALILLAASVIQGYVQQAELAEEQRTVDIWQSALMSVPPGTGMILTNNSEDIKLGKKYNLPISTKDNILLVNGETLVLNSHPFLQGMENPFTVPVTLWYFDTEGNKLGHYIVRQNYAPEVTVYLWDSFVCKYTGVDKYQLHRVGSLVFEEVWPGSDLEWGKDCKKEDPK